MRNRLILSYLIVVIASLIVTYLVGIFLVRQTLIDHMQSDQINDYQNLQSYFQSYYSSHAGWTGIEETAPEDLVNKVAPPAENGFVLVDLDQKVIFATEESLLGREVSKFTTLIGAPVQVNGQSVAYLISEGIVGRNFSELDDDIFYRSAIASLEAVFLGLLVGFVMSLFMIRTILKPIGVTISAAKRISQGDLTMRVPLEPYRDMAPLGEAINEMAADLEKNQQIQRNMLMDIAHDLRTPLSVQQATLEAFEDGIYDFDSEGLTLLKQQNTQLVHLVEDLRLLTLANSRNFKLFKEKVELGGFLKNILNSFESVYAKKGIQINYKTQPVDCMVEIDPHLMQRVFENLLQNAYQYSPEGGVVELRLQRMINRIVVILRDQGPGIPEDKLETIFKRYYRIKQAGENSPEGLGLGLTISKHITEAHGGKLFAQNNKEGGAEFVLELPYPT